MRISSGALSSFITLGGGGLAVALPNARWIGWAIVVAAVVIFWFQVRLENGGLHAQWPWSATRRTMAIGLAMIAAVFALTWYFWPSPSIRILVTKGAGNYPVGTNIGGIKWADPLSDVRLTLLNDNREDYTNINILIQSDMNIVQIWTIEPFSKCDSYPVDQTGKDSLRLSMEGTDKRDNGITVPSSPIWSKIFRIRCDILPSRTNLELVAAMINIYDRRRDGPPSAGSQLVQPRADPKWAQIELKFEASGQSYYETKEKCFAG
jgi:hypothetical protein